MLTARICLTLTKKKKIIILYPDLQVIIVNHFKQAIQTIFIHSSNTLFSSY